MAMGRPPKPTALRILSGNAGRRPLNDREPKLAAAAPEPPGILSLEARAEWDRVCGVLVQSGILTLVDRAILAAYCQAYGRAEIAENALKKMAENDPVVRGLWVKSAKGNPIPNPMLSIATSAWRDVQRFAAELGMTPSARSRIKATDAVAESDNPFMVLKHG